MLHVIGIGSPFGNDQIGLRLVDELRRSERLRPYLGERLALYQLDRPGVSLLEQLKGMERVVIIDAVISGATVGQLHCWQDVAAIRQDSFSASSHGFGLAHTLSLGQALGVLPPVLAILGVEIEAPQADGAPAQPWQSSPQLLAQLEEAIFTAIFHPAPDLQ